MQARFECVRIQVSVQVGGTFTLAPTSTTRPTLFVAGGIGITCLSSMLGHLAELEAQASKCTDTTAAVLRCAAVAWCCSNLALMQQRRGLLQDISYAAVSDAHSGRAHTALWVHLGC
jgi:hypothetical protein